MRRTAPDDDPDLMFRDCIAPKAWMWRRLATFRLWQEYLDGVDHPPPLVGSFEPGLVHVARHAREELRQVEQFAPEFLSRHCNLDYGLASFEDRLVNEEALRARGWVLSGYVLPSYADLLVLTRPGRRTFLFLPEDACKGVDAWFAPQ